MNAITRTERTSDATTPKPSVTGLAAAPPAGDATGSAGDPLTAVNGRAQIVAAGILRSACGAPQGKRRIITYTTAPETIRFPFDGGVIVISNQNLAKNAVLGAIASRMRPLEWRLTNDEMVALIEDIASKGCSYKGKFMAPDECLTVAEFVLDQMGQGAWQVDLRTFCDHALPTYLLTFRTPRRKLIWTHWPHFGILGDLGEVQTRNGRGGAAHGCERSFRHADHWGAAGDRGLLRAVAVERDYQ